MKHTYLLLKEKLRHVKILRVYFSRTLLESGSAKPKAGRSIPSTGAGKRLLQGKGKSKQEMTDWWELKAWLAVMNCP